MDAKQAMDAKAPPRFQDFSKTQILLNIFCILNSGSRFQDSKDHKVVIGVFLSLTLLGF